MKEKKTQNYLHGHCPRPTQSAGFLFQVKLQARKKS
jgi:hypothetical protein